MGRNPFHFCAVPKFHACPCGGLRQNRGDGADPVFRIKTTDGMHQRWNERQRTWRFFRALPRNMSPYRERIHDRLREPRRAQHGTQRPQEKCSVAPPSAAQERYGSGRRAVEEGSQRRFDRSRLPHEAQIEFLASWPLSFHLRRSLGVIRINVDGRTAGRVDAVNMIDGPQFDVLAEFEPHRPKRPLQAWPVQQDVRPGVKRESFKYISGSQPTSFGARLEDLHSESLPSKPQGSRQPSHPRSDDGDVLFHSDRASACCCFFVRGKCKPRSLRSAARKTRSKNETSCNGGNACSSISGTNNEPRPLPKTYT